MAKLGINTGSTPNDGTGDSLLSGAIKVNSNFDEIYSALGDGSTITNSIDFAVIAGYSTASGIATYASNAGIATLANYATSAGIATNASTATYAVNAGFSTGAATADGLAGTPNITVGFVTASYLSGDGGNITGIVTNLTAGNGISLSNNGGTVNVSNNKSDDCLWKKVNEPERRLSHKAYSSEISSICAFSQRNSVLGKEDGYNAKLPA